MRPKTAQGMYMKWALGEKCGVFREKAQSKKWTHVKDQHVVTIFLCRVSLHESPKCQQFLNISADCIQWGPNNSSVWKASNWLHVTMGSTQRFGLSFFFFAVWVIKRPNGQINFKQYFLVETQSRCESVYRKKQQENKHQFNMWIQNNVNHYGLEKLLSTGDIFKSTSPLQGIQDI